MIRDFAAEQHGVISRSQAMASGMSASLVRSKLARGQWQRMHHGTYATFSGPPPRLTVVWAALVSAGDGAVLSHHTAAEMAELIDVPRPLVHVTVPVHRRVAPMRGVVLHISTHVEARRHPTRCPAQTRIEETVLDLAEGSENVDDAVGWLSSACGRRLTTPDRIATALATRPRMRRRSELTSALNEVAGGAKSLLEFRYRTDVELAHGLPVGARQVHHLRPGGAIYDDVRYADQGAIVELEGRMAHPYQMAFRDLQRDNLAAARGEVVLHYGWTDVTVRACEVAMQVETVLRKRGWRNTAGSCGRASCAIART